MAYRRRKTISYSSGVRSIHKGRKIRRTTSSRSRSPKAFRWDLHSLFGNWYWGTSGKASRPRKKV